MNAVPPTFATLLQHVKRATYMTGHCWGQALIASPNLQSPSQWGWQHSSSGQWVPVWTYLIYSSSLFLEVSIRSRGSMDNTVHYVVSYGSYKFRTHSLTLRLCFCCLNDN